MSQTPSSDAQADPRRRRLLPLVVVVALVVVAIGVWLAFRPGQDQLQGMVDADSLNVAAKVSARLAAVHVREGERVEAGQLLFELDSPEVAAKAQQAGALRDAAQAQADKADAGAREEDIRAAEAEWERARAGNALAQSTFQRLDRLYGEGVVSRQRRDEAQAQARSSAGLETAARAQYDMARAGARSQDKAAAHAQVRQAEGAVAEVEAAEAEVRGHAPIGGEVGRRMADIGEIVPAGYPVFKLVDIDHPWVSLFLREDQFHGITPGTRLRGTVPALGDEAVEFEVYYLSPAGDYATWRATRQSAGFDVHSFELRARPVAPVEGLRPGMSVLFAWPQD